LTIGYVVSGKLTLLLAVPPGYASPIFPPAGIAIAAMLIGGSGTLPWTFSWLIRAECVDGLFGRSFFTSFQLT
jgi:hypothetical protein